MAEPDDKKELLRSGEKVSPYGSASSIDSKDDDERHLSEVAAEDGGACSSLRRFIYAHRSSIPGYGAVQLLRKAKPYALYVLFMLLIAYLLNQLDRYTLPVVTTTVGADLEYGDKSCRANPDLESSWLNASNGSLTVCPAYNNASCDNMTDLCTETKFGGVEIKWVTMYILWGKRELSIHRVRVTVCEQSLNSTGGSF